MAERDHVAGVARANLERGVGIGHLARLVALGVAGKQLAVITSAVLVITSGIVLANGARAAASGQT